MWHSNDSFSPPAMSSEREENIDVIDRATHCDANDQIDKDEVLFHEDEVKNSKGAKEQRTNETIFNLPTDRKGKYTRT